MLSIDVNLPPQTETDLLAFARESGRPLEEITSGLLLQMLEDREDYLAAHEADSRNEKTYSLEEVCRELGLED